MVVVLKKDGDGCRGDQRQQLYKFLQLPRDAQGLEKPTVSQVCKWIDVR